MNRLAFSAGLVVLALGTPAVAQSKAPKKPNILVIWGDDIGVSNLSAYHRGMLGGRTPNIDRIAKEGALFTDYYAQQSCTAGRAAFILGQHPFRTGLLTIGMPGSKHGIKAKDPTIAELLKPHGYLCAQFGKNHLGDQDEHLPTNHGFDEFFGNLYHLNAEEEPETYFYPKDPAFHKKFGPRGVIRASAGGKITDTGPLTRKRMETVDNVFLKSSLDFMDRAKKADKPFFIWHNSTRMHVWTRLAKKWRGKTGFGLYADGMADHDEQVGKLLGKLDALGIADNTIVIYSTDNGAEVLTYPDGGMTPFRGEKGTTWEGGFRAPAMVRWPGKIKPGTVINDIFSHEDWLPTLLAAAGDPGIKQKLLKGHKAGSKTFRAHIDGYDQTALLTGKGKGKRKEIFYFDQGGNLNAVRYGMWKLHFTILEGGINTAYRRTPAWPIVVNLRSDPYERAFDQSKLYIRWMADQMWTFVPAQAIVGRWLKTFKAFPATQGSSLSIEKVLKTLQRPSRRQ